MNKKNPPIFIGVKEVMEDWGVSRATAYKIIKGLNEDMKKNHPNALIIQGKVNRVWYEEACLRTSKKGV